MTTLLYEEMTFDQLFRYSEPKRVKRSQTVRGPPLNIRAASDLVYHTFNFKSFPSTTGLRHHGFIKFKKPKLGNPRKPLQHIPCEVDCTCPDYKYRFAWVNKQHGAGKVGAQSMNQAWNRAAKKTNPASIPGLCKHILAARDYIYGLMAKFPGGEPDTGDTMAELVKYAQNRWINYDTLTAKAKDQEKWYAAVKQALNTGHPWNDYAYITRLYQASGGNFTGIPKGVPQPNAPAAPRPGPPPPPEEPPELPPRAAVPRRPGPILPRAGRPTVRGPEPPAPGAGAPPAGPPQAKPAPKPPALPAKPKPGKRPPRKEGLGDFSAANVDSLNGSITGPQLIESMTTLNEAIKLIEEIEDAEVEAPSEIAGEMATDTMDAPPPSEPPVDDTAIGADTEGNVVLQLLGDIKELLAQLVGLENGEEEIAGELPPEGEEEEMAVDAIPEVPEEEREEEEEEEEKDFLPGRSAGNRDGGE